MGFGGPGLGGYTNQYNQVSAYEQQTAQISGNSAVTQAAAAANLAAITANGTDAQLSLQQIIEQRAIDGDLQKTLLRAEYEENARALETATLIASYREKTVQLLLSIQDQRINNVWSRIKSLSQGFKF
jgi:hypothetical protein